ncbi:hypothetical protein LTR53_009633, partial [Teratosphaeriaceae sp. CCFEE 6253]
KEAAAAPAAEEEEEEEEEEGPPELETDTEASEGEPMWDTIDPATNMPVREKRMRVKKKKEPGA